MADNVLIAKKPPLDISEPLLDPETAANLLFQEIGGIELAELFSFSTVSGINQKFNVITNLDILKREYDPTLLVSDNIKGYRGIIPTAIDISEKIPDFDFITIEQYDQNPDDPSNDLLLDLVIILQNIQDDEELEVEIMSSGKIYEIA